MNIRIPTLITTSIDLEQLNSLWAYERYFKHSKAKGTAKKFFKIVLGESFVEKYEQFDTDDIICFVEGMLNQKILINNISCDVFLECEYNPQLDTIKYTLTPECILLLKLMKTK